MPYNDSITIAFAEAVEYAIKSWEKAPGTLIEDLALLKTVQKHLTNALIELATID